MRYIPRDAWMEWCDELNRDPRVHLDLTDEHDLHRSVTFIDYSAYDDILELDVADHGTVTRRFLDHPTEILINDGPTTTTTIIRTSTDVVPLALLGTEIDRLR